MVTEVIGFFRGFAMNTNYNIPRQSIHDYLSGKQANLLEYQIDIEVQFHYTQDKILDRTIQVEYCSINKMIADGLTKALVPKQFTRHRHGIMTPKNVARISGTSVCTTMQRRPAGFSLSGVNQAANQRDINKCGDGAITSLPLTPHQHRQREKGVDNIKGDSFTNSTSLVFIYFYLQLMVVELPVIN